MDRGQLLGEITPQLIPRIVRLIFFVIRENRVGHHVTILQLSLERVDFLQLSVLVKVSLAFPFLLPHELVQLHIGTVLDEHFPDVLVLPHTILVKLLHGVFGLFLPQSLLPSLPLYIMILVLLCLFDHMLLLEVLAHDFSVGPLRIQEFLVVIGREYHLDDILHDE